MGYPTTYVNQFIYDEKDSAYIKIIKYCIMHVLGLFIKVDSYVAPTFYACSFSHNKAVPIAIKKNKCFLSLNKNTTEISCVYGNSNKNWT